MNVRNVNPHVRSALLVLRLVLSVMSLQVWDYSMDLLVSLNALLNALKVL